MFFMINTSENFYYVRSHMETFYVSFRQVSVKFSLHEIE